MAAAHFLLFVPWQISWVVLFFSDPPFEGGWLDFYTFWMRDIIVTTGIYIVGATALAWAAVIIIDFNNEDDVFLIIYPAIILGIYVLTAPATILLVNANWEKTIKFFDTTELQLFE